MKKIIVMSAFCALALTACKDDSEPDYTGIKDADYTGLVLNEVCGGEADSKDDWVELYNTSDKAINLEGVKLVKTDEEGVSVTLYTFASGESIGAKAYTVRGKENFAASISNSKKVTITLQMPSGSNIDVFDRNQMIEGAQGHVLGGSYARIDAYSITWGIASQATKGTANVFNNNDEPETPGEADYTGLMLNELNGNDPKYIELYNASTHAIDLTGVQLRKDAQGTIYIAPQGTTIAAQGYLVLMADQTEYTAGFTGGLSAKKSVMIELLSPGGTLLDVFKNLKSDGTETWGDKSPKYNGETAGMAYARTADGSGKWVLMMATQGTSNTTSTQVGEEIVW